MEFGNLLFGNSRGPLPFPYRGLVDCDEWTQLLDKCGLSSYGVPEVDRQYYGFDNDTFQINPYYWGDCDCGCEETETEAHNAGCSLLRHNFVYKPTGFWIDWYKYPFRDSYMSESVSAGNLKQVWKECIKSAEVTDE